MGLVGPYCCRELIRLVMIPSRSGTVRLAEQPGQPFLLIEGEKLKACVAISSTVLSELFFVFFLAGAAGKLHTHRGGLQPSGVIVCSLCEDICHCKVTRWWALFPVPIGKHMVRNS